MVNRLQRDFPNRMDSADGYNDCMKKLTEAERKEFIIRCCEDGKVNASYLYLATLMKEDFIDKVLTANFDNLVLQAMAYENLFPGVYDLAGIKTYKHELTAKKAVFFLHGQKDGYTLLNTPEELNAEQSYLSKLFKHILETHTLIVIGYSGNSDYLSKHLAASSYPHDLYWIANKGEEPAKHIANEILSQDNAWFMNSCNSDEFFGNLGLNLQIPPPEILFTPFSLIKKKYENLAYAQTSSGEDMDMVKINRGWILDCIAIFEGDADPQVFYKDRMQEFRYNQKKMEIFRKAHVFNEEALNLMDELVRKGNASKEDKMMRAGIYHSFAIQDIKRGDHKVAIEKYLIAAEFFREDSVLCGNIGRAYLISVEDNNRIENCHKIKEAILWFEKAYNLNPIQENLIALGSANLVYALRASEGEKEALLKRTLNLIGETNNKSMSPGFNILLAECYLELFKVCTDGLKKRYIEASCNHFGAIKIEKLEPLYIGKYCDALIFYYLERKLPETVDKINQIIRVDPSIKEGLRQFDLKNENADFIELYNQLDLN